MSALYKINESETGVIDIILNRPELHNAFNDTLIHDLTLFLIEVNKRKDLRLVTLTGNGRSFCAGADLNWMKRMKDYSDQENFDDSLALANLFKEFNNCPVPVLGKVNGAALGGGTGLIAVCDYVLACKSAKIGFTEVKLGLVPAVISPFVIAKIGESNARALFLSGDTFTAQKAHEIGLIHDIVPLDDLDNSFQKVKEKFLKAGPNAAREAKSLIKNIMRLPQDKISDFTCSMISRVRVSTEGQEGMTALLEKRSPGWLE